MGLVWNDCAKKVVDTVKLLDSLGYVVHPEKSVFIPTQKLDFLGFKTNKWNFDAKMSISNQGREELTWWIDSSETASNLINQGGRH